MIEILTASERLPTMNDTSRLFLQGFQIKKKEMIQDIKSLQNI